MGHGEAELGPDKDTSGRLRNVCARVCDRLNLLWRVHKVSGSKVTPVTHLGIERWWWGQGGLMRGDGALQMDGLMAFAILAGPHRSPLHPMMTEKGERGRRDG